ALRERRRWRAGDDRTGARVVHAAVARTDDLARLVPHGASGVRAHRAERTELPTRVADDDVRLPVARIRIGRGLAGGDPARRPDGHGAGGDLPPAWPPARL